MGCTDSTIVAESKPKPVFVAMEDSKYEANHIIMGQVSQNKFICMNIIAPKTINQPLQIVQRPLPELVVQESKAPQKFRPANFAQMVSLSPSSNIYLITGGINSKLDEIYATTYLFNSKQNKIYKLANFKQPRYTHSCLFMDGYLYVIGGRYFGEDEQALLNKCQRLPVGLGHQASNQQIQKFVKQQQPKWQDMPSMIKKRCSQISITYNNKIYVIGGYTSQFQRSPMIQFYNPKNSQWKILSVQLPFGIESFIALANNNNQLTIFGGNTNAGPTDAVLTINLLQGYESIHTNRKMQGAKILHKVVKNQNNIFILGGNSQMEIQLYKIQNHDKEQQTTLNQSNVYQKNKSKIVDRKTLPKFFKNQQQFEALTYSQRSVIVPYKGQPPYSQYQKSANDQIVYVFGTNTQPFILELNISVPYASYNPVPLSIKTFALQGVLFLVQKKQYLLFGGISDSQEDVSSQTYIYKPDGGTRSSGLVAKMATPRYAFGYQKINNWVYAIGGGTANLQGELIVLNKCQKLDIKKLGKAQEKIIVQWSNMADLPFGLISPMTLNYKNSLFVFGGMKQNKQRYKNILKYKQKQNLWQQINFSFSFGLQASSIYHRSQNQFLIFGGRVVNGDTKSIWGLTFINNGDDCVFEQKGSMKQEKSLHHVYKPKNQKFVVVLGGEKQFLSYYDSQNLKPIQSDILTGMRKLFSTSLSNLRDKTLRNYTVAIQ